MARQQTIYVSGKMSNLIFYTFRGKPTVRTMPEKVRQTKATKNSARLFALAAWAGSAIRESLYSVYHHLEGPTIMNRLNGALMKTFTEEGLPKEGAVADLPYLKAFEFGRETSLKKRLKKQLPCELTQNGIRITIPALSVLEDLQAPPGAGMIELKLAVTAVGIGKDAPWSSAEWKSEILYAKGTREEEVIDLSLAIEKKQLVVLAASLRYYSRKQGAPLMVKEKWTPASIVGAWWTGG